MKTTRIGEATDKVTELETVKMSIDAGAVDHLMANLTNLYANPITAILREYVSNAIDSHVRAGVTVPVQVQTPLAANGKLIVKDFGLGMSKDEIANVYSRYGLSTKGGSNDEIGGFGLGCKSALAVADRFDIVATKDGVTTTAYVEKNVKGVGVVHFVSEENTGEANGVTVTIPMPSSYEVRSAFTESAVASFFLGMKGGSLIVDGRTIQTIDNEPWLSIEAGGVRVGAYYNKRSEYGTVQHSYNTVSLTCGGVLYDATGLFAEGESQTFVDNARRHSMKIVLDAPIGSVDLTPSRESLMVTDRTRATVNALMNDVRQGVAEMFLSSVVSAKTIEEAVTAYVSACSKGYWENTVDYRGTVIPRQVEVKNMSYVFSKTKKSNTNTAEINHIRRINVENLVENGTPVSIFVLDDAKVSEQSDSLRKNLAYYVAGKGLNTQKLGYAFYQSDIDASAFLTHLAKNAPSIAKVEADASIIKSDRRKASLAATKAAKASGVVIKAGVTLPVYDIDLDDRKVLPVEVSELQGDKVAYIEAREGYSMLRSFPTLGWQYANGGVKLQESYRSANLRVLEMALKGYKLIFVTSNRKVENIVKLAPKAVPAVPLIKEFVEKYAQENREQLASDVVAVTFHRQTEAFKNLAKHIGATGSIDKINDADFAKALVGANTEHKPDQELLNTITNWYGSDEVMKIASSYVESLQVFEEKYPLAFKMDNIFAVDGKTLDHLIGYINLVAGSSK